jgi:hypothetical protein
VGDQDHRLAHRLQIPDADGEGLFTHIVEVGRGLIQNDQAVNGGVKLGHWAAQNWATLGLRGTRVMSGGQSAALSM